MRRIIAFLASASLLIATIADAQSPAPSRYKVLPSERVSTAALAKAAKQGYRVAAVTQATSGFLLLERSNDTREYIVSRRLLRDIRERRVPPGYRMLPQSLSVIGTGVGRIGPCAGIFERSSGDRRVRDYRVEHALHVRNLQRDIVNAAAEGYQVLAIRGSCAVLERGAAGDSRPYVLIGTRDPKTLHKELAEAVAHGYRLHSGSTLAEFVYLMERQATTAPLADYVFLSTRSIETLVRSMNQAATRGYQLHPFTLGAIVSPDFDIPRFTEIVAVMEKRASPALEYRMISGAWQWTQFWPQWTQFEETINAAAEEGWELTARFGGGALMQRQAGLR